MATHGNFYKFVEELQKQDRDKVADFILLEQGNASVFNPIRIKLEKRNAKIRKFQLKLNDGRITVEEFLNVLAFPKNKMVTEMDHVGDQIIEDEEDEEEDQGAEGIALGVNVVEDSANRITELQNQLRQATELLLCIVCQDNRRSRCLLPCLHLAICEDCSIELIRLGNGNRNGLFRCPVCRGDVTEVQAQFF